MPIRKDESSGIWYVDVRSPSGQRFRHSARTTSRKAAQEYHDHLKMQLWRSAQLGETQQYTFEQAAVRFLREYEGDGMYEPHLRNITYWRKYLTGRVISSLTTNDIKGHLPTHTAREYHAPRAVTPATRNRYLSTIRRMLNLCREWGWVASVPILRPEKEPKVRVRWITRSEAQRLLAAMTGMPNDCLYDMTAFALATGMRAGEILRLQWSDVDLARSMAWVTADKAKSGKARGVPLNPDAVEVIRGRMGSHPRYVFTRSGRQQKQVDLKTFIRACQHVGIEDFRFHDLRHTWASWHAQSGTPLFVLKELGGWETLEMVKKYAHMNDSTLAKYADAVKIWSNSSQTQKAQP